MMQLQRKVKVEKFFGGANHKMSQDEKELSFPESQDFRGCCRSLGMEYLLNENRNEIFMVNRF